MSGSSLGAGVGEGRQWTLPACSGISASFQVKAAAAQVGDRTGNWGKDLVSDCTGDFRPHRP
jgi:hypothetical protein